MRALLSISRLIFCLLVALPLAGCGSGDRTALNVIAIGEPEDPFETGARLSFAGQLTRASTAEGLVAFDAEGRVIPALADRWIVTDDGRSYIFRLRDGTWKDGTELTAKSAVSALRDARKALRGTALGLDLEPVEEIREMAGRVVEIRLSRPLPYLLQVLAQPELGLVRSQGAGPMKLDREDDVAVLTPLDPQALGLPQIEDWEQRIRPLRLVAMDGKEAVERFNATDADLVLGGRIQDFPYTRSVGILRGTIQLDPVMGLFGLLVRNEKGFLSEPANREAIAMAIDRDALIAPFGVDGWNPSTRIVPPDLDGDIGTIGERWPELTLDARRSLARARVNLWREEQGEEGEIAPLRIELPQGPGSDILFRRISQDLAAIGLQAARVAGEEAADLQLIDDVARYPRASWFLNRLNCGIRQGVCSKDADARVAEAAQAADPAERAALMAEAEAELTEANGFIPFGPPIRWSLVRGTIDAFAPNPWGWHPLMPMAVLPR